MARAARERLIHFGFTALVCIIPMWYPLGLHCFIHFPGIRSRSCLEGGSRSRAFNFKRPTFDLYTGMDAQTGALVAELEAAVLQAAQAAQQQSDDIRALEVAVAGLDQPAP